MCASPPPPTLSRHPVRAREKKERTAGASRLAPPDPTFTYVNAKRIPRHPPPPTHASFLAQNTSKMSSWFSRAISSAKEAVGSVNVRGVGDSARSLAGGVLSSVARVADDKVRRVGKSLHARVTGRQSFEDAVSLCVCVCVSLSSPVSAFARRQPRAIFFCGFFLERECQLFSFSPTKRHEILHPEKPPAAMVTFSFHPPLPPCPARSY